MYVYTHACMHTRMYAHVCTHKHMCMHTYAHTCMYTHMYVCTRMYIHTCWYTHTYVCTHTLCHVLLHCGLLQRVESNSLSSAGGPCLFNKWGRVSANPHLLVHPPPPFPLVALSLSAMSESVSVSQAHLRHTYSVSVSDITPYLLRHISGSGGDATRILGQVGLALTWEEGQQGPQLLGVRAPRGDGSACPRSTHFCSCPAARRPDPGEAW